MKRVFVVDDERPVIEGIELLVRRDLAAEFEVVGSASSGRGAIERAPALVPDIVLMDVRMPGIQGLEAIRELRRRGFTAVFILVTAYERFDIAREAVELGVLGYLLKPLGRDDLARALRGAADHLDRLRELERREVDHRERAERLRGFVETALLHGLMLGEEPGPQVAAAREALGLGEPNALAIAAVFPPEGDVDGPAEARALHARFRETLRYRTRALAGPLVAGHCIGLLPARDPDAARGLLGELRGAVERELGAELARGRIRLGLGSLRPLADLSLSWAEALADLGSGGRALGAQVPGRAGEAGEPRDAPEDAPLPTGKPFEEEEEFLTALSDSGPARAALALERLLASLDPARAVSRAEAGRVASLFGAAYRLLSRRGALTVPEASGHFDFSDLRGDCSADAFRLAARARLAPLTAAIGRAPRHSPPVTRAFAWIRENWCRQAGLEPCADTVGISPNRLSRLFVEETGRGFSDWLIEYRIARAKELLAAPGAAIKEVSAACGYPDPNYFSRLFKKLTGLTPTAYATGTTERKDDNI